MKKTASLTAALAAGLLLAGTPLLASADDMQGPIQVNNVQFTAQATAEDTYGPENADISFTNNGSMPATEVLFEVKEDGNVVDFYDATGTFTPGVAIDNSFASLAGIKSEPDAHVIVSRVMFADGSVWANPDEASDSDSNPASG
jgi:hypothetical protein